MIRGANHNELSTAFQKVKSTVFDLCDEGSAAHFALNITHGTSDNSASLRGFGAKHLVEKCGVSPDRVTLSQLNLLHRSTLSDQGKKTPTATTGEALKR